MSSFALQCYSTYCLFSQGGHFPFQTQHRPIFWWDLSTCTPSSSLVSAIRGLTCRSSLPSFSRYFLPYSPIREPSHRSCGQLLTYWVLGHLCQYGGRDKMYRTRQEIFWSPQGVNRTIQTAISFITQFYSYLLNPYVFLPTLALSSSSFQSSLTLLSVKYAAEGGYRQYYSDSFLTHSLYRKRVSSALLAINTSSYRSLNIYPSSPSSSSTHYWPTLSSRISTRPSCQPSSYHSTLL